MSAAVARVRDRWDERIIAAAIAQSTDPEQAGPDLLPADDEKQFWLDIEAELKREFA